MTMGRMATGSMVLAMMLAGRGAAAQAVTPTDMGQAQMKALEARMAALGPEMAAQQASVQAQMEGMQAQMEAKGATMAALGQARMAGVEAQMARLGPEMASMQAGLGPEMEARMAVLGAEVEMLGEGGQASGGSSGGESVKDDLFAGTEKFAKNATEATEVNMSPDDLESVRGPEARRAHRTVLNVVHTYEFAKPGMYSMAEVDEYRRKLDGPGWHCSVRTRDLKTGGSTDVCSKRRTDGLKESAVITVEPKGLTFIHTIRRESGKEGEGDHDSD